MLFPFPGVFLAWRYLAVIFQCRNIRVWHMSGRGGMRRQKAEVSPFNIQLACKAVGSSHLVIFFHSKGTQTRERRVPPNCLLVQTDRQTLGHLEGIPGLLRTPPPASGCHPGAPASLLRRSVAASTCRGRPGSAARPLPPRPPPPAPPCWVRPAQPGPSEPFLAQPPPKPGEVESRRRCSLRGPRGAALGMLSRRSQCCSK